MKGYKVFDKDWMCQNMRYEVGKTYKHDGELKLCKSGFHFCEKPAECWNFKTWTGVERMAEVEASGEIVRGEDKCVTDEITIMREIPATEMLELCNIRSANTGVCNTGYCNTGNHNTGDRNTGNRNTGCFCTKTPRVNFFDMPSDWTFDDWDDCFARSCLCKTTPKVTRIYRSEMNADEIASHPEAEAETTGEYLKVRTDEEMRELTQKWWDELQEDEKQNIWSLPNFDKAKFEKIMYGIDIGEKPDGVPPQALPETVFWHLIEVDGPPDDEEMHLVSTATSKGERYVKVAYWMQEGERWVGNIGSSAVYAWADIKPCEVI